jgi:hypothetical protein
MAFHKVRELSSAGVMVINQQYVFSDIAHAMLSANG